MIKSISRVLSQAALRGGTIAWEVSSRSFRYPQAGAIPLLRDIHKRVENELGLLAGISR